MPSMNFAPLIDLLGFLTGAALYGLLLSVALRRREILADRLPPLTAVLGLAWNVTALAAYGIHDFAGRDPSPWLVATAYSALGFLPAVVVHSFLRSRENERSRPAVTTVIVAAYAVSTFAETLMFWAARGGHAPSVAALQILTWFYAILIIPVLALKRGRGRWSIVALAVFAVSALHLSHHEGANESWLIELGGHHASIPLIFAILYQDFRFALADQFLKRALTLFATIAIAATLYIGIAVPVFEKHAVRSDPVAIGMAIILWVATAMVYPLLARGASWFVDRVVLRRVDYRRLCESIAAQVNTAATAEEVLEIVCSALRPTLAANIRWSAEGGTIPIVTTEAPHYALVIGAFDSGRSLLSDDTELLHGVAMIAGRRIDAIRFSHLVSDAELRALRSQINPHFLFNALNTIGFLIQTAPSRAQATLLKLTALLRAVLHSSGSAILLGDEIDVVSAYLEIEQARFEERLRVVIDVPDDARRVRVPPLVVQPLVENAIKHGIARSRSGGEVRVVARIDGSSLSISVSNSGTLPAFRNRGIGLSNVEQRLRHQYGEKARLSLTSANGETVAEVLIPAAQPALRSA
jgi:two-component system LytT family sensor kinase